MFTKRFYEELFSKRENVCVAFDKAKNMVDFQLGTVEANLFMKLTKDDPTPEQFEKEPWRFAKIKHTCEPLPHIDEMR